MRTLLLISSIACCTFIVSCQQSLEPINDPVNIDSTANGFLVRTASFNKNNDSVVTNYEYNTSGHLIKQWNKDDSTAGYIRYLRDSKERIISIENVPATGTHIISDVHYADDNSGKIAYTVSYKKDAPALRLDSLLFTYENGKLSTKTTYWRQADILAAVYYETLNYDAKGNIIQVQGYTVDANGATAFNLGYDFVYDNYPNPYYSQDDALHIYNWYYASPNNITKQINHYDLSNNNNDYVTNDYQYDTQNRPVEMTWSGPFIDINKIYFHYNK